MRFCSIFVVLFAIFPTKASADAVKEPLTGYYMLFEASDLQWFAQQVSAGNDTICGRLYNDIYLQTLDQEYWQPIGSTSAPFRGKFDGNNHVVYNLTLKIGENSGLFGYVENATIMNTIVNGPQVASNPVSSLMGSIGAVCGEARASVIRNCHTQNANMDFTKNASYMNPSYVGGVCGSLRNESRMVGCSASGKVLSVKDYVGGIVGVISLAEIDSCTTLLGDSITSVYARSYAGGIAGGVFSRSIASSIHNCTVASGVEVLSNDVGLWATVCPIEQITDELNLYNGAYEIYTPKHLAAFRDKVNGGDIKINGRLMNNISMASFGAFGAIGKQSAGGYQGVFDGQNYTIDSLTIVDQAYAGLFAYLCKEGTVVRNLVLNAPSLNTVDNDYLGFLVGMATQKAAVDNCHVTGGNLLRTAKGTPECVGGIAGKADLGDSAFANCKNLEYFDVVLSSTKNKKHYTSIHAREIPIGEGVFDGCPNLKIRIPGPMMDEFRTDTAWSKYKDQFVETDFGITAFTEGGVYYSYYISEDGKNYYTNKNADEMTTLLTPYVSQIRRFTADQVLDADNSNTLYYVYANGVDNTELKKKGGELRLYNDIGTYYNYKTIAVSATAFRNNEEIKKIVFEDCASGVSNANTMISLFIPNGAFQGCKNLKELNLYYLQTDDNNRYYALKPSEVFIGSNVFDGVDENFRIVVSPEYYSDFVTDDNWTQYAKYIVASDYLPTNKAGKTIEGLTYDYAATSLNTIPTSTMSGLQLSYVYTGLHLTYLIASSFTSLGLGIVDKAVAGAWKAASLASMAFTMAKVAALQYQSLTQTTEIGMTTADIQVLTEAMAASYGYYYTILAIPNVFLQVIVGAAMELTSYQAYNTVEYAIRNSVANRVDYLSHRIERSCKRATLYRSNGLGMYYTQQRTNIPQMYISHVSDDTETARIYNDIGTGSSDYHTTAVGSVAFRNKTNLKKVEFYDRLDDNQSLSSMQLILPDSCFLGCTNLTTVDLVLTSKRSGGKVALTPDNFILSGRNLFAGCDTTKLQILVGRDVLDEYLEDPFWSIYANRFVAVDLPSNPVKYTEGNINYGYAYYNNTTPLQTEINDHTIKHLNVVSGNDAKLKSNNGQATLVNDIGTITSYKVDNIEKRAFKGNDNLKAFHFMDTNSNIAQAYTDLSLNICDSAFANCKNFETMYLVYWKTSGTNNSVGISPDSLRLGNGVFDGCDNLRIKIDYTQKEAFLADTCWNKYADKIVPCLLAPRDETVYNVLKDFAYTSPLPNQATSHIDISTIKPWDVKGKFRFERNITSFDEFSAFELCGFDSLYNRMFELCSNMQSITIPNGVRKICDYVFFDCNRLTRITIPSSVRYLGNYVFKDSGIKEIFFESKTPPHT